MDKIVPKLIDDAKSEKTSINYPDMTQVVKKAIENLEKILDLFPSLKVFSGNIDEISTVYNKAIEDLKYDLSNLQTLKQKGKIAKVSLDRLKSGLEEFSKAIESVFNVDSLIDIDKPSTTPKDIEPPKDTEDIPDEEEQEQEPDEDEEETPAPEDQPPVVTSYVINPEQATELFSFWKAKHRRKGLSKTDFNKDIEVFSNFIGPFLPEYILKERSPKKEPMDKVSDNNLLIGKKIEIKNKFDSLENEEEKESISRVLNAFMPLNAKKQKVLSKFLRNISIQSPTEKPEKEKFGPDPEKEKIAKDLATKVLDKEKEKTDKKMQQQAKRKRGSYAARAQKRQAIAQKRRRGISVRENFEEQLYSKLEVVIKELLREKHG